MGSVRSGRAYSSWKHGFALTLPSAHISSQFSVLLISGAIALLVTGLWVLLPCPSAPVLSSADQASGGTLLPRNNVDRAYPFPNSALILLSIAAVLFCWMLCWPCIHAWDSAASVSHFAATASTVLVVALALVRSGRSQKRCTVDTKRLFTSTPRTTKNRYATCSLYWWSAFNTLCLYGCAIQKLQKTLRGILSRFRHS